MYVLIFVIGIIVGVGAAWFVMSRRVGGLETELRRTEKEREEEEEIASGFDGYNTRKQEAIELRKGWILEALRTRDTLQRSDVAEMFDVSSRTAFNYLEELEQEGKVVQVGDTGRSVLYRLAETAR